MRKFSASGSTAIALRLKRLGQQVGAARRIKEWSQEELATRASVARRTIQNIEQGSASVAIGIVLRVCQLLDLNVSMNAGDVPALRAEEALLQKVRRVRRTSARKPFNDPLDF